MAHTDFSRDFIREGVNILKTQAEELYLRDYISESEGNPEPLEFYREWVSPNIPVVFREAGIKIPAIHKWTRNYLRQKLSDKLVTVAVTPNGYADAISDDGKYFMLPEEKQMKFSDFIDCLEKQEDGRLDDNSPVLYMQQQNSNLTGEMKELLGDVPPEINWATEAFGQNPDAVNFWMGDLRAITSTHKDPYENLYCVISGEKTFVLTPPTDLPGMPYQTLPIATYSQVQSRQDFQVIPDKDGSSVRWICPDSSMELPSKPKPITVTVKAGDILYLPSLWFHQVSQSHCCVAVNYWYDMRFDIKFAYYSMLEHFCSKFQL